MWKLPSIRSSYDTYIRDISIVFLLLLPLTISNAISIFVGHFLNVADLPEVANKFFYFSNLLIGIYPSAFCLVTTYYLSTKHNVNPMVVVPYSLVMFLSISLSNGLVAANGLPNNPLVALLTAVIASAACVFARLYPLDPSRTDFVSSLYKQAAHFFGFLLLTILLTRFAEFVIKRSSSFTEHLSLDPLTFDGGMMYVFVLGLLGSFGINGHNLLFRIKQQLFEDTQANIAAWQIGDEPLNILSQGFYDAFLAMGGSGNSLSLLLCILMFSREKRHITLALSALPLVMFNINELLLFGLPIIFNPTMIIPFIMVPMVSFVVVYVAIGIGWVNPISTIVDWMTPPLLSGYLATDASLAGIALQVIVVAIGIGIYRPFYLHYAGKSSLDGRGILRKMEIESNTMKSYFGDVNQSMDDQINRHEMSKRINRMLNYGEFLMYYQPQVNVANHGHVAFESLIRYRDEYGNIHPPTFIADFQKLGAIKQLDEMVIDLVLADMRELCKQGSCKIALNVSADTISDRDIVDFISERLHYYQILPEALEIEITEETILEDHEQINRNIDALQKLGVTVAIDDFGSGYASFPHLLKYNFDKVKLDRSLLSNVKEERGQNLYQLLAKISEVTGCALVAEGVETSADKAFVESCGIDILQGYYFSHPMPLSGALEWARQMAQRHKHADEVAS